MTQPKRVRDPLYGFVELDALCQSVVDTEYFQRLRSIRQLGCTSYVWPFANGTRFAHSLGTMHVARKWMNHLALKQPELQISERMIQLVCLAALCHDIGHVLLSHIAEEAIERPLGIPDHEQRSQDLFRYIVEQERLSLTGAEVDAICAMIRGDVLASYPPYMFEMVHNAETELDVDKVNYLQFDSYHLGFSTDHGVQLDRIIHHSRIINGHLCFEQRVYLDIYDIFLKRYREHKEALKHHAVIAAEKLMVQILALLSEVFDFKALFTSQDHQWTMLTDGLIDQIPLLLRQNNSCWSERQLSALRQAEDLRVRLCRREWARVDTISTVDRVTDDKDETSNMATGHGHGHSIHRETIRLALSGANFNPMTKIRFYRKEDVARVIYLDVRSISKLLPVEFEEQMSITVRSRSRKNKKRRVNPSPGPSTEQESLPLSSKTTESDKVELRNSRPAT